MRKDWIAAAAAGFIAGTAMAVAAEQDPPEQIPTGETATGGVSQDGREIIRDAAPPQPDEAQTASVGDDDGIVDDDTLREIREQALAAQGGGGAAAAPSEEEIAAKERAIADHRQRILSQIGGG